MTESHPRSPFDDDVRAVVLAGGASKRMGQDKSLLMLDGKTMLDWVSEAVSSIGVPSSILREDLVPGLGPLEGIRSACKQYNESRMVFLSCDMPFVGSQVLRQLIDVGSHSGLSAICSVEGRLGFPILFSSDQLAVVTRRLDEGRRSILGLFEEIPSVTIPISSDQVWRFCNVNTPEDLGLAKKIAIQHGTKTKIER